MTSELMTAKLDKTDWEIIQALQENARLSFTELGQVVGLSRPAVAERVRRLEESQVITGYRAEVNLAKLGYTIVAFVRISAVGDVLAQIRGVVKELPEVLECHRGTGNDCFILKIIASSIQHLEKTIDRLTRYGQVTTSLVLSSVVTRRIITKIDVD
jgi:Lrp/AsnC family leucine-responsive transcriptional regulator